jgi:hypothetical protein
MIIMSCDTQNLYADLIGKIVTIRLFDRNDRGRSTFSGKLVAIDGTKLKFESAGKHVFIEDCGNIKSISEKV